MEYQVMGIHSMEPRSENSQVIVSDRYEAMKYVRQYRAELKSAIVLENETIVYSSTYYWPYWFSNEMLVAHPANRINWFWPQYQTSGGDFQSIFALEHDVPMLANRVDLADSQHLLRTLAGLRNRERLERDAEQVPINLEPIRVRNKLLNGYLQYHGYRVGTQIDFQSGELQDWFAEIFEDYLEFRGDCVVVVG